jgi:UDP-glucose 4-epimerase
MTRILITGSSGLVGGSILKSLSGSNNDIIGTNRTAEAENNITETTKSVKIDLSEQCSVDKIIKLQPEIIIHTAAQIPTKKIKDSMELAISNQIIDDNVFRIVKTLNCWLIYLSGTNVYGMINGNIKVDENYPLCNNSKYAEQKIFSENIIANQISKGLILRLNAPYGETMKNETVLSQFVYRAKKNLPLMYHGSGERSQDFTHVVDVGRFVRNIINQHRLVDGIFNISYGSPVSMKKLAQIIKEELKSESIIVSSGVIDKQENYRANYSVDKARNQLNWEPKISIRDGIRRFNMLN